MGIVDEYTAFCLDEACAYIAYMEHEAEEGNNPHAVFTEDNTEKTSKNNNYTSASEMYRAMGLM